MTADLRETDASLIEQLTYLADEYGPRGVAETLEQLHPGSTWRTDSVTLNTVAWRIAQAIGAVPAGASRVDGRDVLADLDTLLTPATPGSFPSRNSDPGTSDLAASRHSTPDVGKFTAGSLKARVLREIADRPNTAYLAAARCVPTDAFGDARKWASRVETARKRVSDLSRAGYLADSGRTRINPGADTPSIVWEVTAAGRQALVKLEADGVSK